MKQWFIAACLLVALAACNNTPRVPDVSHIKVDLRTQRFEQDFFNLDIAQLSASLDTLYGKYPRFLQDFLSLVMAYEQADTALKYIPAFITDSLYRDVYHHAQQQFPAFDEYEKQIERSLQFVKHHFPDYTLPTGIVTFVGPIDGVATGITNDQQFAIGLQGYLGSDYPAYHTAYVRSVYPEYQTRKFIPSYIVPNCMASVVEDIYPTRYVGRPLIEQMIEAGKKLYLLQQFMPEVHDTLITGYTRAQMDAAYQNEQNIWAHFLNNNLLFVNDPVTVRDYMNEAPYTLPLGQASPGFIGKFVGWQIIKKWMAGREVSLPVLLQTPARQIFEEANYKPV